MFRRRIFPLFSESKGNSSRKPAEEGCKLAIQWWALVNTAMNLLEQPLKKPSVPCSCLYTYAWRKILSPFFRFPCHSFSPSLQHTHRGTPVSSAIKTLVPHAQTNWLFSGKCGMLMHNRSEQSTETRERNVTVLGTHTGLVFLFLFFWVG
jgi:hypothetical protein